MSDMNSKKPNPDAQDAVGYGKPPKKSQFIKGKSGNPKGRPKGSSNFSTYLDAMLKSPVTISDNGRSKKVTTMEAGLARLREKALKGDPRALAALLDLAERHGMEQAEKESEHLLSKDDQAIFETYTARIREECEKSDNDTNDKDELDEPTDTLDEEVKL